MFTIELTPKQIKAIYEAGIIRGLDESELYYRGIGHSADKMDYLRDLLLSDRKNGQGGSLGLGEQEKWWEVFVAEMNK